VGELAVRPAGLAPLVEQLDDLGLLGGQQAIDRRPARLPVIQAPGRPPAQPPIGPHPVQLQQPARAVQAPAGIGRVLDQLQQAALGDLIDPARNPAT